MATRNEDGQPADGKAYEKLAEALRDASKAAENNADKTDKLAGIANIMSRSLTTDKKQKALVKEIKKLEKGDSKHLDFIKESDKARKQILRRIADSTLKMGIGQSNMLSFWHQSGSIWIDILQNLIGSAIQRVSDELAINTEVVRKGITVGLSYQDASNSLLKDLKAFSKLNADEKGELALEFLNAGMIEGNQLTKQGIGIMKMFGANSTQLVELSRLTRDTMRSSDRENWGMLENLNSLGKRSTLGIDRMVGLMRQIVPSTQHLDMVLSKQENVNLQDAIAEYASKAGIEADKIQQLATSFLTNVQTGLVAGVSPEELRGKSTKQMVEVLGRLNNGLTSFQKDLTPDSIVGAMLANPVINALAGTDVTGTLRGRQRADRVDLGPKREILMQQEKRVSELDYGRIGNEKLSLIGQTLATQTKAIVAGFRDLGVTIKTTNTSSHMRQLEVSRDKTRRE